MGDPTAANLYPGRDTPSSMRPYPQRTPGATVQKPFDPTEDDPVDHKAAASSSHDHSHYVVAPSIHVQSEFPTITRSAEASQPLTCLVVVELPGKRQNTHVPGSVMPSSESYAPQQKNPSLARDGSGHSQHSGPRSGEYGMSPRSQHISVDQQSQSGSNHHMSPSPSRDPLTSPLEREIIQQDEGSPFNSITEDLRNRIIDWKGHPLSGLGALQMYDLLSVRRDALVREFFVYLFKEAIICVVEEKKRTLGRLLSSAGAASAFGDGTGSGSINSGNSQRGVLRLKGRIYIRHIRQVTDTSVQGELSLTIDMEDERLDSFILIFKDRSSLETWKQHIQVLVAVYQQQTVQAQQPPSDYGRSPDLEEFGGSMKAARMLTDEFGGSQKAMRMLSGSTTGTTVSTADSLLNGSVRSTVSSNTSYGSAALGPARLGLQQKLSTLDEDEEMSRYSSPAPQPLVAPHMSTGPSNSLAPLAHPPMDLILVISVPGPNATPSTATLKVRVIKTSLDFILHALSPKDRLSLVTFEVGIGGRVRRTPFLSVGKPQSRQRLVKFVEDIGRREDFDDEFIVRGSQEEKTDVVTAVNNGMSLALSRLR